MTSSTRVSFRDTSSPIVRQYCPRFQLFVARGHEFGEREFDGSASLGGDQELLNSGWRIANGLFALDGIDSLMMRPFEVNIYRAPVFDWSDLHDNIMQVIKAADPKFPGLEIRPDAMKSSVRRIHWFDTKSDVVRHYGVSTRLFTPLNDGDTERNWPGIPETEQSVGLPACNPKQQLNEAGYRVFQGLTAIDGVSRLTIRPYEVNVYRYGHFEFEEMHKHIIAALRTAFGGNDRIEVQNRRPFRIS